METKLSEVQGFSLLLLSEWGDRNIETVSSFMQRLLKYAGMFIVCCSVFSVSLPTMCAIVLSHSVRAGDYEGGGVQT